MCDCVETLYIKIGHFFWGPCRSNYWLSTEELERNTRDLPSRERSILLGYALCYFSQVCLSYIAWQKLYHIILRAPLLVFSLHGALGAIFSINKDSAWRLESFKVWILPWCTLPCRVQCRSSGGCSRTKKPLSASSVEGPPLGNVELMMLSASLTFCAGWSTQASAW